MMLNETTSTLATLKMKENCFRRHFDAAWLYIRCYIDVYYLVK